MLFQSSLRKELARSFGATLVVLITIILTIVLIRTLGLAARGQADPQDVILLMAYATLGRLPTILSLSLFIAILSTLSRLYRDSEMVVWFASGRGLGSFLGPVLRFAWPTLLVIALSALWLWPWTNEKTQDLRNRYQQRSDLDRIAPGQFQESSDGSRVFFIDRNSQEKSGNDIFIAARDAQSRTVVTARAGRIEATASGQLLTLEGGQRMEIQEGPAGAGGEPGKTPGLRISQFDSYGALIGEAKTSTLDATSFKFLSTWDLMQTPSRPNQGELAWRFGLTLSGLSLVLLAVAMAHASPRAGRSGRLILAIFIFLVYSNLMTLSQNWVSLGWIGLLPMVLLLHGGFMAVALLWLLGRHRGWALPRIEWRARRRAAPEATA